MKKTIYNNINKINNPNIIYKKFDNNKNKIKLTFKNIENNKQIQKKDINFEKNSISTKLKKEIKYNNKLGIFVLEYKKNNNVLLRYPPQIIIKYYLYVKEHFKNVNINNKISVSV